MSKNNDESVLRKLLRSEITWTVSVVIGVMGFVKTVVIPINNLQLQVAEIQRGINSDRSRYDELQKQVNTVANQSLETATKLNEHLKGKN
jgi:hypothetical protein